MQILTNQLRIKLIKPHTTDPGKIRPIADLLLQNVSSIKLVLESFKNKFVIKKF